MLGWTYVHTYEYIGCDQDDVKPEKRLLYILLIFISMVLQNFIFFSCACCICTYVYYASGIFCFFWLLLLRIQGLDDDQSLCVYNIHVNYRAGRGAKQPRQILGGHKKINLTKPRSQHFFWIFGQFVYKKLNCFYQHFFNFEIKSKKMSLLLK